MKRTAFLVLLAASIVVTAASLGFSTSRYLAARTYAPRSDGRRGVAALPREEIPPPERWANIFAPAQGMEIPSRLAGGKADEALPPTAYVLIGTIASPSPADRRAILWAEGMKAPRMVRENEELEPGIRVASIDREHILLARGGKGEKLDLLPVGSRARAQLPPPAPPSAAARVPQAGPEAAAPAFRVTRVGENAFTLDDASIAQLTGNINQYMAQVRLIPYFEGNKSSGYRLAAIRPGSAFDQLGFRGGDIIQQVNGLDLSSPEKMYGIFQNLKDQKRVTVDILRQGQKSTLTYEIR